MKLNEQYAVKLEKKRLRQKEIEEAKAKVKAEEAARAALAKVNPFSVSVSSMSADGIN